MATIAVIGNGLYCRVGKPRSETRTLPFPKLARVGATQTDSAGLTIRDVAQMTAGVSVDTLKAMQLSYDGPEYVQLPDGSVRYTVEAVRKWQALRSEAHRQMMQSFGGGCAQ